MAKTERVREDIYLVQVPIRDDWFGSVAIILGPSSVALVDTGFENTPQDDLFPFLKELGRSPEDIRVVVNTHRDGDHVKGNRVIKEQTPARILIHELEFDAVDAADERFQDGDTLHLGDRTFTVMHTPGHRPGNICLYDSTDKLLLTGDTVCGDRKDLIRMGKVPQIASLKKLSQLSIDIMALAPPVHPAGKTVLNGAEAQKMISDSIAIAEQL